MTKTTTKDEIIHRVRIILDEDTGGDSYAAAGSSATDSIIAQTIDAAIDYVYRNAPLSTLGEAVNYTEGNFEVINSNPQEGYADVSLSDDVVRVISVNVSEWCAPLETFETSASQKHQRQYSRFAGMHATARQPLAVTLDGERTIRLFPVTDSSTIDVIVHKKPTEQRDGTLSIKDTAMQPICYVTAGLVCKSLGDERGDQFIQTARAIMRAEEPQSTEQ